MTAGTIGVDIGGTAARYCVLGADGSVIAQGSAPGATGHLFNPTERERFVAAFAAIAKDLPPGLQLEAGFAGVTGMGEQAAQEARALIGQLLGMDPEAVTVRDDMELAFLSAFAPGQGHMISAGTGSIGLHVTGQGQQIRVGGRGLLIDDGGSGTWIALTALDRLYRLIDADGTTEGAPILAQELFAMLGGSSWDDTRAFVYGSERGRIGTLAQAVARAATRGDSLAQAVLDDAAKELARLAHVLIGRAGALPVAFVGGIVTLHPTIKPALGAALPGVAISFPTINAALRAAELARARRL